MGVVRVRSSGKQTASEAGESSPWGRTGMRSLAPPPLPTRAPPPPESWQTTRGRPGAARSGLLPSEAPPPQHRGPRGASDLPHGCIVSMADG